MGARLTDVVDVRITNCPDCGDFVVAFKFFGDDQVYALPFCIQVEADATNMGLAVQEVVIQALRSGIHYALKHAAPTSN